MMSRCFSFLVAGATLLFAAQQALAQDAKQEVTKIRWVLAHEPASLFIEAANSFKNEVERETHGAIQVEVLTMREYAEKYNHGNPTWESKVLDDLAAGNVEMSQTYTTLLGDYNSDLRVLDLPFLFKNHAHAQNVLEGQIGKTLLAGLAPKGIHGLAFTYSGGYRIIPSKKPIRRLEDFKGLELRTSSSPVAQDMIRTLGAVPVPGSLESVPEAAKAGKINSTESTYVRYYAMKQDQSFHYLNDTGHSLFLTSIVMSDRFWNQIPKKFHGIIQTAALHAGRLERKHSIEGAKTTRLQCEKEGVQVIDLPASEKARFKSAMKGLYEKYQGTFSSDLVAQIQKQ